MTYTYDDVNRLQQVITKNEHLVDYAYDGVGNRQKLTSVIMGSIVAPSLNAIPSADTDFVVYFDGSGSACFENGVEKTCDYSLDYGGAGTVIGGNGIDVWVYEYNTPGAYDATLMVSFVDTTGALVKDSRTVSVEPLTVEKPKPAIDFMTSVNGREVTLTATTLADIRTASIYWGDRAISQSLDPENDFATGMTHTYSRGGRSYNIRIEAVLNIDSNDTTVDYFHFVTLPITLPFVCRVNGCLPLPSSNAHLPEDFFGSYIPPWKKVSKQFCNVMTTE
ncbi:MAG: hypothetical protein L6365_10340 [Desulfobulbaceae bacterium]|nr:hypothetical protein [Desulfobulbaceae bacterium]